MNGFIRPVEVRTAKVDESSDFQAPKFLNWTAKGFVNPVESQGLCGSCWSFSSTGAIEGQMFKKTGILNKLSEQNLIDCNRDEAVGNYGCQGGDMMNAFNYVVKQQGISLASKYPYKAGDTFKCNYKKSQSRGTIEGFEAVEAGDENLLKNVLTQVGPISIAVDASLPSFQSYKSGVYYDHKCSLDINHAMLLVGYGIDKKTKQDYWYVKNSYGSSWGENGYIRMARNRNNHCGITEFAVYPIV
jgi:cathepsin L